MISAHEVPEGETRCKHCGAFKPGPDSTCILRAGVASEMRPEPSRRVLACEDIGTIADRLAELSKEREAALNMEAAP